MSQVSTRTGNDDELPEALDSNHPDRPEPTNGSTAAVTALPASGISQPGGDQP
jgi:hypothetical protein